MAITFRANKGTALSYTEMDQNLGQFFYSSSVSNDGTALVLHYTGSANVPINQTSHTVSLIKGLPQGLDRQVVYYSGSLAVTGSGGFIVDSGSKVGINTAGEDLPLTYNLEVSGSIRASQAVLSNSDERLKENIKPIEGALGKIISSNGVSFNRTESPDIKELGVIAQQIENYIPEVVYKDKKDYLSVNYGGIVPVLIEAIKELEARVQELENK